MSTPEERMRALRWGWELLRDIQQDATVPVESGDSAKALALRYPARECPNFCVRGGLLNSSLLDVL